MVTQLQHLRVRDRKTQKYFVGGDNRGFWRRVVVGKAFHSQRWNRQISVQIDKQKYADHYETSTSHSNLVIISKRNMFIQTQSIKKTKKCVTPRGLSCHRPAFGLCDSTLVQSDPPSPNSSCSFEPRSCRCLRVCSVRPPKGYPESQRWSAGSPDRSHSQSRDQWQRCKSEVLKTDMGSKRKCRRGSPKENDPTQKKQN